MIRDITENDLFKIAMETITMAEDNTRFLKFADTLIELCNKNIDDITIFRLLNYTRVRLYALRNYPDISDESSTTLFNRSLEVIVGYIDTELKLLTCPRNQNKYHIAAPVFRWTGSLVELVEIIYALDEIGCINDGQNDIKDLAAFFGSQFGMEIKVRTCYDTYLDIKRRKNDSRTYFLDRMRERLNLRMQRDDEKERMRR